MNKTGTGKFDKNGVEIQVGDIVHFRLNEAHLSGKGRVYLTDDESDLKSLGSDRFRIIDTREGKKNGCIYPYYDKAVYRIDVYVEKEK